MLEKKDIKTFSESFEKVSDRNSAENSRKKEFTELKIEKCSNMQALFDAEAKHWRFSSQHNFIEEDKFEAKSYKVDEYKGVLPNDIIIINNKTSDKAAEKSQTSISPVVHNTFTKKQDNARNTPIVLKDLFSMKGQSLEEDDFDNLFDKLSSDKVKTVHNK